MLDKLFNRINDPKTRNVALTGMGMAALLFGRKATALSMFSSGARGLEKIWREKHPDFHGDWSDRWRMAETFYEQTHRNQVNRVLHMVGIPMIVSGAVGLVAFKPFRTPWNVAATSFAVGWALNFVGHAVEGSAPALADDPLSFIAGPAWDFKQIRDRVSGVRVRSADATDTSSAQPAAA